MRLACGLIGIGALSFGGCLDSRDGQALPDLVVDRTPIQVVTVRVPALGLDDVEGCYALRLADAEGETWWKQGDLSKLQPSRSAAIESGALCGEIEQLQPCERAGTQVAELTLVGLYDEPGVAVATSEYDSPCPPDAPCRVEFECAPQATVEFDLDVRLDANQGLFDVFIDSIAPAGVNDVCYAIRVDNGEEVVWALHGVCSTVYGTGTGDLTYVGHCDANVPQNVVTLWIESVSFGDDVAEAARVFGDPCPAPSEGDIAEWTGGCSLTAACFEDHDTPINYNLHLTPPE